MDTSDWSAAIIIFVMVVLLLYSRASERRSPQVTPGAVIDRHHMRRTDPVWKDRGTL